MSGWSGRCGVLAAALALSGGVAVRAQTALVRAGSFAQLAWGTFDAGGKQASWKTTLLFMNVGAAEEPVTVRAYRTQDGAPLELQVKGGTPAAIQQLTVPAGGMRQIELDESAGGLRVGWAEVVAGMSIRGQGVYTSVVAGQATSQAVVPLLQRDSTQSLVPLPFNPASFPDALILPYDNKDYVTSYAFANTTEAARTLAVKFVDENGAAVYTLQADIPARGHTAFETTNYVELRGKKGQAIVMQDAAAWSAIGFLFNDQQRTFTTTLPVLR